MTTPAVFRCTYSDWKVVKGRKVVQVVLEMPLETADTAYQVLGGMPSPAAEVWCAVARLNEVPAPSCRSASSSGEREPESDPGLPAERGHKSPAQIEERRKKFAELPYAQQAALRCQEPLYRAFLREVCAKPADSHLSAGDAVRDLCEVESRAHIKPGTDAEKKWLELEQWFAAWLTKERAMA